jgi:elongation factor P
MEGDPWEVLDASFVKMAQRTGHVEAKIRNVRTGIVLTRSFKQSDAFEEADIERVKATFVYRHRGTSVFANALNPRERFELPDDQLGDASRYLVPKLLLDVIRFRGKVIGIILPPKVDLRVVEAPPWVRGNTATSGTKIVTTETGLKVRVPPFIEEGSVIRVNTKTGEYVERVEK